MPLTDSGNDSTEIRRPADSTGARLARKAVLALNLVVNSPHT
jgi:hypothetical protein